ncbi:MAG TPA: asparagine synthase (glutamine-hydrolyzing) [Pyrinomonadaceae bacterium]
MCGIGGIWGSEDESAVRAMVGAMRHRGPDDSGVFRDADVVLGMTRLSIIDVSDGAHQPFHNPEKTLCIVYNGEVYNFQAERGLLEGRGYSFSSASDTEVVLRMYEHYGDDFLLRLRGMFALAIYDKRRGPGRERLLLARDPFGIKPLLYARARGGLVFASELKALLESGLVERSIDPEALRLLLTFGCVQQPRTMIDGVRMLPPAHRMIVERGHERVERYWVLARDRRPELRTARYEDLVAHQSELLRESVRLHLVSDVPVGAFLSGGVDSSLLVALMAQVVGTGLKTYSVGYEAEGADVDESDEARRTAHFIGADHTHVLVRGSDVREQINLIASGLDQPSADGVNTYFVSQAARRGVKVAISGTGSDEIFAGYYWFTALLLEQRRGAHDGADFLDKFAAFQSNNFSPPEAARVLHPELRRQAGVGRTAGHDLREFDELPDGSLVERTSALSLRAYLNNRLLRDIDAASMSHSLEVRVPFVDREIVDAALSLPDAVKLGDLSNRAQSGFDTYRATGSKRIILDIARPLLPEGFDERTKRGFQMPFTAWLKGPLREVLADALGEEQVRRRGLLDAREVSAVRRAFMETDADPHRSRVKPWILMMLELWCREVLDRPAPALDARKHGV